MPFLRVREHRRLFQAAVLAFLVAMYVATGVYFHVFLQTNTVYTHVAYIPIVLAGMWWGRRALAVAAILGCVIVAFRLSGIGVGRVSGDAARIALFGAVALCVGELREKVRSGQDALGVSEEKYRQLAENSLAGICVYRDGRVIYVNSRCSEMLGYRGGGLIGRSISEIIYDEDKAKDFPLGGAAAGFPDLHYECRLAAKDGSVVWVDVASSVVDYGDAPAVLVYMYDISDRKEAEQKRRELSELARKQEEQLVHSTRLAELGEMAAAVAHELNQPLTGIRNFARNAFYMIEKDVGTLDEVKDNLRLISDQVDRASRIINQMRELTRKSERQFALVDVNGIVRESVEFLTPQLRLSGVETTVSLADDVPAIVGDRIRLEQVFLNLLTNARQAMDGAAERRLSVRTYFDAGMARPVVVEIADTGKGFAPEEAAKLFTPFYSTKQAGHGTGLGLAISLTIIEEHNGAIDADGSRGNGATFRVRLPVSQETNVSEADT